MASTLNTLAKSTAQKTAALVFGLSLFGYPLVAALSQFLHIENRLVSIPLRALVLGLGLLVMIIMSTKRAKFTISYFWIAFWSFWLMYLLRMVIDFFFNPDALKIPLWEYLSYAIGVSLVPAVALSYRDNVGALGKSLHTIMVWVTIASIVNLWVIFYQRDFGTLLDFSRERVETETINPIAIAHLGATAIILALWSLLSDKNIGLIRRATNVVCCFVGVGALIAGGSRGPLLALAVVIPVMVWGLGRIGLIRGVKLVALLFVCAMVALNELGTFDFGALYLIERLDESAFVDSERSRLLREAIEIVLNNPLAGGGIEPLEIYPHNVLIESFLIMGVATGVCFSFLFFYSLLAALSLRSLDRDRFWVALIFIQYLVGALVSGSLYMAPGLWVPMAAVVALRATALRSRGEASPVQNRNTQYDAKSVGD